MFFLSQIARVMMTRKRAKFQHRMSTRNSAGGVEFLMPGKRRLVQTTKTMAIELAPQYQVTRSSPDGCDGPDLPAQSGHFTKKIINRARRTRTLLHPKKWRTAQSPRSDASDFRDRFIVYVAAATRSDDARV